MRFLLPLSHFRQRVVQGVQPFDSNFKKRCKTSPKIKTCFVYFRFVFQFYAVMVARWLISDNPSLLRLSNIGRGALHLQSACLKICECAPIFNLALCTYGGYRYCLRLNRSVVKPRLKSKLVSLIFVRKLRNISLFSGKCSQFLVTLYQNSQLF